MMPKYVWCVYVYVCKCVFVFKGLGKQKEECEFILVRLIQHKKQANIYSQDI